MAMRSNRSFLLRSFVVLGSLAGASTANAGFITPTAPGWVRGNPFTTFQTYETFSSVTGPNAPTDIVGYDAAINPSNPNGSSNVWDTTGGSFLTSGGNIYSPGVATNINITVPEFGLSDDDADVDADYFTTVLLQFRTQGSEANYGTIRLTYNNGVSDQTIFASATQEYSRAAAGPGGAIVDYGALFQVPYSPSQLKLFVDASGSSMSFDRLSIDTIVTRESSSNALLSGMNSAVGFVPQTVLPEPATASLLAIGGLMLGRRRRGNC